MSGRPHTVHYLRANPEYHPFIKWLIGYDKKDWTTLDLKQDYPAYNPNDSARMLRKLWKFDIIRREKRAIIPEFRDNKLHSVWRFNVDNLDSIKKGMEVNE